MIGARYITQWQQFPTTTLLFPHLRCSGFDAAPHLRDLPGKEVANKVQGDGLHKDAGGSL
jgi:hypothetical protein